MHCSGLRSVRSFLKLMKLGSFKHRLELDEPQGDVVGLDVCEDFLAVVTENGFVQMWKLDEEFSRTWLPGRGRKVSLLTGGSCSMCSIKCNYNGTIVSLLAKDEEDEGLHAVLYVYDIVLDKFYHLNFRLEEKLLIDRAGASSEIVMFCVDSDFDIIKKDKVDINYDKAGLLGKCEPYAFLYERISSDKTATQPPMVKKITMGILASMEKVDGRVRQDLLNLSNHLFTRRDREADKALESVRDVTTLKKLARYCVKHGFQDFALQCFANMGRAYSVSSIRTLSDESLNLPTKETKAAAVAIQLGCVKDAEELYMKCERYDLLIHLYQTCGYWEKSIEVALKYDHVNLKNAHHVYAKHLEAVGDIQTAIQQYELSNTHRYEVPRMLYSVGKVDDLKKYVDEKKDAKLYQWWANYCEAKNMLHNAIDHYKLAGDISSVVRVHCFLGDFEMAENIVAETSDLSATFHLGQQYEKLGNIARAIQLFAKAGRSDCAANLAMKHGIDKELLSLALQGSKKTMLSSANYFEEKGSCEEAVLLYQKGGDLEKAVDVCVHFELHDALRAIADNLNEETDPSLLTRCGDFLLQHKQFEKALLLLIAAGQHRRALELCTHERVQITDKMMELFSKQISEEKVEDSKQLLSILAEFCEAQGSFHLACRTYTEAGDKVKAMKALTKSGDTEKILMYANVSRQKQLYVLAASYLQTLNWHHDPDIMKKIVQMYTKAAEMELLASFYEACAQVEIDGFRDYEKALSAMREAWKFLCKVQSPRRHGKMESLKKRIEEVECFVQARRMAKSDPNRMISACVALLAELSMQDRNGQAAVRIGDVYALLIEFYYKESNMSQAYETIQTMNTFKLPVGAYIDQTILDAVYQASGASLDH